MVILYDIRHRITLVHRADDYQPSILWNLPMDKADFRIYTGVDNQVDFALRGKDRKVVNIVGRQVRLVLKDRYTGTVLAEPYLETIDIDKALMRLTLTQETTENWPIGSLSYCAVVEEPDGSELLLFTDEAERGQAFCYVMASPLAIIEED